MSTTPYDAFAWFYNRYWGGRFINTGLAVLDELLLPHVASGAHILDLCCGTGNIAAALAQRGFKITGVDNSAEMLKYARENAPAAQFMLADARSFAMPTPFQAAISMFDSLNHLTTLEDLAAAFRSVRHVLCPGGRFLFDLNMVEGFENAWKGSQSIIEPDHVLAARLSHDLSEKTGRMDIAMFRLIDNQWQRSDATHLERAYSKVELESALREAGFDTVDFYDSENGFLLAWPGRLFVLATAPAAFTDCA